MATRRRPPAPGAAKPSVPVISSRPVSPPWPSRATSDGGNTTFSGADPGDVLDRDHPDLAVADTAGGGGLDDDVDDGAGIDVLDEHLDTDLRHEVDGVLSTPVHLAVSALATVSGGLAHGHPGD